MIYWYVYIYIYYIILQDVDTSQLNPFLQGLRTQPLRLHVPGTARTVADPRENHGSADTNWPQDEGPSNC